MKKTLFLTTLLCSGLAVSQVAIGKNAVDGKALLDFGNDGNKGIILPIVDTSDATMPYTDGTFLMDKDDLMIKVRQNDEWLPLSDPGSVEVQKDASNASITTAASVTESTEISEGAIIGKVDAIGKAPSGAVGVLVLEADDKALVLPKVANPHLTIKSPVAGTMCYDTISNSVAIFDGKVWNYWK